MSDDPSAPISLSLFGERIEIGKVQRVSGRVRVRTETEVIEEMVATELGGSRAEITRVPVNRAVETAPEVRTEGDVTIISIVAETLVIERRLVVTEEVHIRCVPTLETVQVPVSLRRQHAIAETLDPATGDIIRQTRLSDISGNPSEDKS